MFHLNRPFRRNHEIYRTVQPDILGNDSEGSRRSLMFSEAQRKKANRLASMSVMTEDRMPMMDMSDPGPSQSSFRRLDSLPSPKCAAATPEQPIDDRPRRREPRRQSMPTELRSSLLRLLAASSDNDLRRSSAPAQPSQATYNRRTVDFRKRYSTRSLY